MAMVFASVVLAQAPVQKAKVLVSDGTVSLLTEIPGGDSLLRNSQVGKADSAKYPDLLGIVIDNARNSAAAGNAPATLALKVTDELRASLNSNGLGEASSFAPIEVADGDYEVKLLLSARFNRRQESKDGCRPHRA